jgi:hypothetical protein
VVVVVIGVVLGEARLLEVLEVVVCAGVVVVCAVLVCAAEVVVCDAEVVVCAEAAEPREAALEPLVRALEARAVGFEAAAETRPPVAPVVDCDPVGFCADVDAWPWKPLAATTARAPESAAAAARIPRVIAEIRRRPASRARIARRVACSGPLLAGSRRELTWRPPGSPSTVGLGRSSLAIVGRESETTVSGA